ncbi:TIGR04222 domain-containing membrane protein [Lentzea sp. NPDC051213]|uniref:TIGR04222 domain-containing membrane protein n=1 Tax=Lentzea sp. NPDC051213 TaxID=3364126 RepID=UPI003788D709
MTTKTTPEELGCLAGGPIRATEVALARLLDVGLIRISREGVVTAVHQPGQGPATPLEAQILNGLRAGRRTLQDVRQSAAYSAEAEGLRAHLVGRGLLRRRRSWRPRLYPWLYLLATGLILLGFVDLVVPEVVAEARAFAGLAVPELKRWMYFAAGGVVFVWAIVLSSRDPGRLRTRAALRMVNKAQSHVVKRRRTGHADPFYRLTAVAVLGLGTQAAVFGLDPGTLGILPERDRSSSSSCGSGCSSGGSSCSSGGDSGGDSGGGGCGGGCGGGGGD